MFELYQARTSFVFVLFRSLFVALGILVFINGFFPGFIDKSLFINHKYFIIAVNSFSLFLFTKSIAYKYVGNLIVEEDKLKLSHTGNEIEFKKVNIIRIIPNHFDLKFRSKTVSFSIPKLSNEEYTLFFKNNEIEKFNKIMNEISENNNGIIESNYFGRKMYLSKKEAA